MKGAAVMNMEDDITSNLTTASGQQAVSASSVAAERNNNVNIGGSCNDNDRVGERRPPKNKKGRPCSPDAEVIAMSPKSLLSTNRFTCEVCNKGFQRDQNLQLHRRGHNLPWKLKQRPKTEPVRRKVYLCPEPTCAHHHPSRALGDLTGIKKHFSRKHGEKRWKCDRCEKKYAVQSDWKAHSKVCGTRKYKCDCGSVFSRRDSFITHRTFCDAITHEAMMKSFVSSQLPAPPPPPFTSLTNTIFAPPPTHAPLCLHDHVFNHGNGIPPPPAPLPIVKLETGHVHLPMAAFPQQQQTFCFTTNPNHNTRSSATGWLPQELAVTGASDPSAMTGHVAENFILQDTSMSMTAIMMMNSIAVSEMGTAFDDYKGGDISGILNSKGRVDHHVGDGNIGTTRDFMSSSRDLVGMRGDDGDGDDDISCLQQQLQEGGDDHHRHQQEQQVLWLG